MGALVVKEVKWDAILGAEMCLQHKLELGSIRAKWTRSTMCEKSMRRQLLISYDRANSCGGSVWGRLGAGSGARGGGVVIFF